MAKKQYLDLTGLTTYDEQIKSYIDAGDAAALSGLTDGTTVVKEAEHADTADSATTATTATNANHATTADSATTATKATQLANSKSIILSGDASGSASFNGTADATITVTIADDSHNHVISNVDGLQSALDGKAASGHNHDSVYYAKSTGEALASTVDAIKEDVDAFFADADFTTNAKDTLKEIQTYITSDASDAADMLASINNKADKEHTHAIADVSGLQTALDGKAAVSHGTHVTFDSTNKPKMDGTAAFGTSTSVARADHVHPTDTSRASQADLDALEAVVGGKADSGHTHSAATTSAAGFMTADMVTKLNGIATGANKTTVDTTLSTTSTNPVQNKLVTTAINSNTSAISANTSAITAHTSRISALEGLVGEGIEAIPTSAIQNLFN